MLLARRRSLTTDAITTLSSRITTHILTTTEWQSATSIAAFVGVRREPDTTALLSAALREGKSLWLPRVLDGRGGHSELAAITDLSQLAPAGFGLREPIRSPDQPILPTVTHTAPLDLLLIPGLAFDTAGARLGFGVGHYDRLLHPLLDPPADPSHTPTLIGVCFASFLHHSPSTIPTQPHDVPMHAVATDEGITWCRPRSPRPPR